MPHHEQTTHKDSLKEGGLETEESLKIWALDGKIPPLLKYVYTFLDL